MRLAAMPLAEREAMAERVRVITWRESARQLAEIVLDGNASVQVIVPCLQLEENGAAAGILADAEGEWMAAP